MATNKKPTKKAAKNAPHAALVADVKKLVKKHATNLKLTSMSVDDGNCPPGQKPMVIEFQTEDGTTVTKIICV